MSNYLPAASVILIMVVPPSVQALTNGFSLESFVCSTGVVIVISS